MRPAQENGCSVLGWTSTHRSAGTALRKLPKTWRSLQGWQRLAPGRSRKPWVRAVWSGIACRLVEQGQHSMGLLVMTGLLSCARPGEFGRMRQCDLVPPLRWALQNFSIILAAEETGRPTMVQTFSDTLELDVRWLENWSLSGMPQRPRLEKPIVALHLSDFLQIFRHSRRFPVVGASQKTRTMASHENCPTIRETLLVRTKLGNPVRKSSTASPALRRTARGCVARRSIWDLVAFAERPLRGTRQVCNELRKQEITARMWTGDELTEPSAFRSLARECKNGRLRAAFMAPHLSEDSMVLKVLERLRALKDPLLVECGRFFFLSTRNCENETSP